MAAYPPVVVYDEVHYQMARDEFASENGQVELQQVGPNAKLLFRYGASGTVRQRVINASAWAAAGDPPGLVTSELAAVKAQLASDKAGGGFAPGRGNGR